MLTLFKLRQANAAPMPGATHRTEVAAREALSGQRKGLSAFLPFVGPAMIASVAYMDPGNFATNIQAGSTCGYELLWVVMLASMAAMLFQAMSAKLGIVTGSNLAELCREQFPTPVAIGMWCASEVAAMATDIAEFLGGALGVSLLFHVSILFGLVVTGVVTSAILLLDKGGFRPIEILIALLVAAIGLSFVCELAIAPPDWHAALTGSVLPTCMAQLPSRWPSGLLARPSCRTHSICTRVSRKTARRRNDDERRRLLALSNREVLVALGIAGFVNLAMVMMFASVFSKSEPGISDISVAYHALVPLLGVGAATVFLISLIASGISSSVVGTMAGQVVIQGFVNVRISVWVRRVVTMIPAFVIGLHFNVVDAMIMSQVALSFILPLPLIALVVLSSRRAVMGNYAAGKMTVGAAAFTTVVIVLLNASLIHQALA
jgi:manganese transport protein